MSKKNVKTYTELSVSGAVVRQYRFINGQWVNTTELARLERKLKLLTSK